MKKTYFMLLFFVPYFVFSQEPLKRTKKILYKHERNFGVNVHSLGWGVHCRRVWNDNVKWQHFLELDIVSMKHPKQVKTINTFFSDSKGYDYGKQNSTFLLRSGFGKQLILFDKPDFGGIMVSAVGALGVSLAFLKPVYLEILYTDDITNEFYVETEKYNPIEHSPYNIYGRASYFKGFDEMQLQVGSYLKAGFSFEFSKKDDVIRSIETGVSLDAFKVGDNNIVGDALGKELPVMAITKNKKTFFSFYINMNFFFGKKW
ncbi:MAG TPA: hypothetical protein QGG91_01345 [Flavobacteriales bacterium]|nr:hypothetical protein [Flavobacteriales bacterium]